MAWQGHDYVAFEWVLVALSFFLVAVRLHVTFTLQWRRLPWQECFPVMACVLYCASAVCNSIGNSYHFLNGDRSHFESLPRQDQIIANKAMYAYAFLYKPTLYACKASLLCFYYDISPKNQYVAIRRMIYVASFFTLVGFTTQILYPLVGLCRPMHLNWLPEGHTCTYKPSYFYTNWILHIFSDVIIYIIPFFIVYHAKRLTMSKKMGILSMFAVGFLNIFIACAILYLNLVQFTTSTIYGALLFLSTLQQFTAILIVCMPQLRLLYRKKVTKRISDVDIFPWKKSTEVPNTVSMMQEEISKSNTEQSTQTAGNSKRDSPQPARTNIEMQV